MPGLAVMSRFDPSDQSQNQSQLPRSYSGPQQPLGGFPPSQSPQRSLPPPSQTLNRTKPAPIAPQKATSADHPAYGSTGQFGFYPSPHSSTHSLPPQQHSYNPGVGQVTTNRPNVDTSYYAPHQSPFTSTPGSGGFGSPAQTSETMAAPTHMRQQMTSYGTPHSNSPTSSTSQSESHGRHSYGQPSQQNLFYPNYSVPGGSPYLSHAGSSQPHLPSQAPMPVHYQQSHPSLRAQTPLADIGPRKSLSQGTLSGSHPYMTTPQLGSSRPPGSSGGIHGSANSHQNANPGPIPATQPIVMKKDNVDEISFEYSRDRIKVSYTIRGDVEKVDTQTLPHEFKENNCVYPRAYNNEDYKGNRLPYETECNKLAWALARLNPVLEGRRGLIQRAVDSWRNCHKDPKLRSRRVRRMQKQKTRQANTKTPSSGSTGPGASLQADVDAGTAVMKQEDSALQASQVHHHHLQQNNHHTLPGGVSDSGGTYNFQAEQGQSYGNNHPMSPVDMRPPYQVDHARGIAGSNDTPTSGGSYSTPNRPALASDERTQFNDNVIFGDLSNLKQAGAQQINDCDGNRVRVPRGLTTDVLGITPDWRSKYAIFPRSNNITSPTSPALDPNDSYEDNEDAGAQGMGASAPPMQRISVPLRLMNGFETTMHIPKMTNARRTRERILNEMGFRMSWGRRREFSTPHQDPQIPRTMFLQRALDSYRKKVGDDFAKVNSTAPSHFETRPGRRKWNERPGKPSRNTTL